MNWILPMNSKVCQKQARLAHGRLCLLRVMNVVPQREDMKLTIAQAKNAIHVVIALPSVDWLWFDWASALDLVCLLLQRANYVTSTGLLPAIVVPLLKPFLSLTTSPLHYCRASLLLLHPSLRFVYRYCD